MAEESAPLDIAVGRNTNPAVAITNEEGFILAPDGSPTSENLFGRSAEDPMVGPPQGTEEHGELGSLAGGPSVLSESDHAFLSQNPSILTEITAATGATTDEGLAQILGDARNIVDGMGPGERQALERLEVGNNGTVIAKVAVTV